MSAQVLNNIPDIKIPYPREGIIRTAQLDDTIAPADSVQLAVNMNFDRVGAIQTRPGVTQYADDLPEEISNYGTLRNAIVPPGYANLYQLGAIAEIEEAHFADVSAIKVSDTKIAAFWTGASQKGYCRLYEIDQVTGDIVPLGTRVEFESSQNAKNCALLVNGTHAINVWQGPGNDGFVRGFDITGNTIVPESSALEFDTSNGNFFTLALIDSSHAICFYTSSSDDGVATVFAIDSGGAVTEPGSPLTFASGANQNNSCVALGDGTHFVNFWQGATALAQCFVVNTGTWAITANGSALNYDTLASKSNALAVSTTRVVNVYQGGSAVVAQTFAIDGSFAVTEVGTPVNIDTGGGNDVTAVGFGDGLHFVAFYSENVGVGYAQMFERNSSTSDMSLIGSRLGGYDFANGGYTSSLQLSSNEVMVVWGNVDAEIGQAVMFQSFGDVVQGRWLYASHGDEVSNVPAGSTTWTTRRSGLAEVGKPRFSQYLNYIWMVNGNEQIGGDPVATSNGGAFGTDLVPENFPQGDFIHAGFEGRVWVANKTLGIIYYTDIVQFIPPVTYQLTYNPTVNYISTISPQTGQSFTALYRVPRALLVFTEDTITRIYGASSIDAYPAYNVGTYSQESIIETKTGIFFHHSSGFYQFDYGSQPVEISRRIIDFVKAIDREYYPDITGVYDGFDNVEWSVGQLIVEGVVFSKCVLRYTISTQVWTVYDYKGNTITAMIFYDDGTQIVHLMGTEAGKTGAMDVGTTDFGSPFYYEFIDRWRSFTEMYYKTKAISGFSIYSENAAGANLTYQKQKSGPNAWKPIGTVDESNNSLLPNSGTEDFDVLRLRLAGTTKGVPVVVHGIEITQLTIKGQEEN